MNRIDRLFAILTTLQSRKFASAEYISEKYNISIRTVYRDLKALGETGVPVGFENQNGYYVLKGYFLPPISLSSEEANALILTNALAEKFADKTVRKNSDSALSKIKAVLKNHEKEDADFLQSQIKIYMPAGEKNENDFLTEIKNAIIKKQVLKIEYRNNDHIKSTREIEAIGLTFYSNQWHLIAWCWQRRAYRDFKTAQLIKLVNTGNKFRKSDHYDINDYIRSLV